MFKFEEKNKEIFIKLGLEIGFQKKVKILNLLILFIIVYSSTLLLSFK